MADAASDNVPRILDQLGPYKKHPPVEIGCTLSEAAFKRYHQITGSVVREIGSLDDQTPPRMMYLAEAISTGLRLNATWGLSFPAMSLVRDRYEQTVRFSWLIRNNDPLRWKQYAATYYTKWRKLYAAMSIAQRTEFDKLAMPPGWMTESATPEQRKVMARYASLSLADMAAQRDKLAPLGAASTIDATTLSDLYSSIYVQYSSVTHYDFFAVQLLQIFENPAGEPVLAVDPFWPATLVLQNCLFDILQCREATAMVCDASDVLAFEEMHSIWEDTVHRGGLSKEEFEKATQVMSDESSDDG